MPDAHLLFFYSLKMSAALNKFAKTQFIQDGKYFSKTISFPDSSIHHSLSVFIP